ncbi:MAG: 16S rRNA (adenine(1518)-N(6)/adenine(1519)-N(6))-dimethyltransferase RsmA [Oscillospiraceae bacterium]|nr:16S rRNA (adenine(1518)-N(6)/adenine(1519)-N(6))-dimethyltransferase RsmA [Candidatus Limimonas coprohippi]MCQ2488867.1 16S rRNA (adenine(1518)-N(6)/adenine(1519)-N(6))-dimethyltransferase RsmA [Clostridia bacterium]
MYNLSDINTIKSILSKNGFSFSKALGQNFIVDSTVCPKMAEEAILDGDYGVVEVGPGIGVLTAELAKRAKKVVAVELDDRLPPILNETLSDFDNVKIVPGDIMKIDVKKLIEDEFPSMKVVVCANLPYYITSPVIMKLLQENLPIEAVVVMVQKEAADRLCADVGTRDAGAVTVAVNYYAEAEKLFFVPRDSFMPAPKVDSEVIKLSLRTDRENLVDDEDKFFTMVKTAFTKRRKTIMNSLCIGSVTKELLGSTLDELEISRTARIEELNMDDLVNIYNKLYK